MNTLVMQALRITTTCCRFVTLSAVSLLASGLGAQSRFIPSDTPTAGACNITPFGEFRKSKTWVNQKYQCLATGAQLGNKSSGRITDLGFAPCSARLGVIHFDTIEVVLAQTRSGTLGRNFSKNLASNVRTVLKATSVLFAYPWARSAAEMLPTPSSSALTIFRTRDANTGRVQRA